MTTADAGTIERAMLLRRMMDEYLRLMTPEQRDRSMQIHLAQARGPEANVLLLRHGTNALLRMKKAQGQAESDRAG